MKYRIAMWAGAGFLIAGCWALYAFLTAPMTNQQMGGMWTLARLTCPVIVAGTHFPLSLYWALIANTATFALAGLIVETLRQTLRQNRT